ncbi:hybrid sensor histidine kinase/response regulator [Roseovarius salinarum]|uniref:hybrid sensor histidine kinase/response regulator n=1 Tax=Roseovarius salinarum TaxID=1981892 RepID=UPI002FCDC4CF
MAISGSLADPARHAARILRPRASILLLVAMCFAAGALIVAQPLARLALVAVAGTLAVTALLIVAIRRLAVARDRRLLRAVGELIETDAAAAFLTGPDGAIVQRGKVARDGGAGQAATVAEVLRGDLADPAALVFRLATRAENGGAAVEEAVTRAGRLRVSAQRIGADHLFWRIERAGNAPASGDSVRLPMLIAGRNDTILYMNPAARQLIGERARNLERVFPRRPLVSGQINEVATADGLTGCMAVARDAQAGRREVFLLPEVTAADCQPDGWAFFDALPVALLKLDRSGNIVLSNRPARDLLCLPEAGGGRLAERLEGLGRPVADWLADAADGRGTVHSEFLRVRRDDRETFVQVMLNPAREDGETILIAVLSDATELKSLEAQFVQSQKMQAIGQLAGGVAHDFNNLLTAITGHCDLLLMRHDAGDPDYGDLLQINQNANRAAALVGQLLAYSRKQTLRPEIMDLRDTLADLTHLLNRLVGEKVTLSLSHDPLLWSIRADRRQLEQVLMNLVVNARDAMPDGGEITIETANRTLESPLHRERAVVAAGRYVCVRVRDEGEGIAPDKLQKVFEPFYTTKRTGEGTGLGLSTAYGIVKQTGGFIFADSTPGQGTSFEVLLPAYDTAAQAPEAEEATPATGSASGVILLVEDEAPVRAFAARALQMRGFTVLEAESAEDALEILQDASLHVDLFVTDVIMPGVDGPTWVREAVKMRPEVGVVFISGYAEEAFGDLQQTIPQSVFLPKPFSLSDLTETVCRQLAGPKT